MEILLLAIVAVPVVLVIVMYNGLVRRRNDADNAFASIDAMLKKRTDLIPNLVAAVQQYMQHESGTLKEVTALRAQAVSGKLSPDEALRVQNALSQQLRGLMVAVESYPQLRASENFQQLQRSLNEVEEQISAARRAFNAAVNDFNIAVETFPGNILAGMFGFRRRALFEIPEEQRQTPDVQTLFKR